VPSISYAVTCSTHNVSALLCPWPQFGPLNRAHDDQPFHRHGPKVQWHSIRRWLTAHKNLAIGPAGVRPVSSLSILFSTLNLSPPVEVVRPPSSSAFSTTCLRNKPSFSNLHLEWPNTHTSASDILFFPFSLLTFPRCAKYGHPSRNMGLSWQHYPRLPRRYPVRIFFNHICH
jgi:hypothetical protein